jgi:hypothetical protein
VSQIASEQSSAGPNADGGSDGISGFLTRILDQLSLSSWLPAIMVICNLAVLLQLCSQKNLDISAAVLRLTGKPLGILVVLVLGIIVASIATQAFEFESIRLARRLLGLVPDAGLVVPDLHRPSCRPPPSLAHASRATDGPRI